MRGTRWLILIAILAILGGVGATYRLQKRILLAHAPPKPAPLPMELSATRDDWSWSQRDGNRLIVEIQAKKFGQSADNTRVQLEGVELHRYHQDGLSYDLVRSAQAEFKQGDKSLFSEGQVDITLNVPTQGKPPHALVSIHSSGVTYFTDTGKAMTARPATFTFENGDGKAVGASYDPTTKELLMDSQVAVNWRAPGPHAKPMLIEAGQLIYKESAGTILLTPWARLTRENTVVEGAASAVTLQDGVIHQVESFAAHGVDSYPTRKLQYAADHLWVDFDDDGDVRKITGMPNARLVSTQAAGETTITADRVEMLFTTLENESVLTSALANGNGTVISKPLPAPDAADTPETRILRSQVIDLRMRPGGKELDNLETQAPGSLEFLPNSPRQHRRLLTGQHFWIQYGSQNHLESFRTIEAKTETDPTPEEKRRNRAPVLTSSRYLTARFDPKTNRMIRMEQRENFTYQEGERKARANKATLDSDANEIALDTAARMWDSMGATSADVIHLDQRTGNFTADGHVNSSHLPDQKKKTSDLLSGDEPMQALAQHMTSGDHNRLLHYEGNVVLWQGADRLQADRVEIDRARRAVTAHGNILSQFRDQPQDNDDDKKAATTSAAPPVFTIVKATDLVYTEENRLAHYKGGVVLNRPGLQVKADDLRAFLAEAGADSRLEKAYADGHVQIVDVAPDRTRTGLGMHAEYYTADDRIVLKAGEAKGSEAQLIDSLRGNARGAELTYFSNDDRLLVNGSPGRPAVSRIRKK